MPKTALDKEILMQTVKNSGEEAMIWGCLTSNCVGQMEIIESTMVKYAYLNKFEAKSGRILSWKWLLFSTGQWVQTKQRKILSIIIVDDVIC